MSQQVEKMHLIHDDDQLQTSAEDVHDKILEECSLAKSLEETFQVGSFVNSFLLACSPYELRK